MTLRQIRKIEGTAVPIPGDDLDTDQIAPARYLKVVTFDNLAHVLFRDARTDPDGHSKQHPLDDPKFQNAKIIVTGRNFGCGSSREHAPQSIGRAGFDAIVAESFGEIFFANCTTLGIPCVTLKKAELRQLTQFIGENPSTELRIDLEDYSLRAGDQTWTFTMRDRPRNALMGGYWDALGILLEGMDDAQKTARQLPYMGWTTPRIP